MSPSFAVVIPTYKRATTGLVETLTTIVNQTCPPDEVIVVDDGSPDNTADIVRSFAPKVTYIRVANGGPSTARNIGVGASGADWIAFCDDDDLWTPDYLATVAATLQTAPDVRFCFTNSRLVRHGVWDKATKFDQAPAGYWEGDYQSLGKARIYHDSMLPRQLIFQPVLTSCSVLQRAYFNELGGYRNEFSRIGSEDWELTLRALAQSPVAVIFEPLVGIRRTTGSVSSNLLFVKEGEVQILEHAREHYPWAEAHRVQLEEQIRIRRRDAANLAFTARRFDRVQSLTAPLSRRELGLKLRLKQAISKLPSPFAFGLHRLLSRRR